MEISIAVTILTYLTFVVGDTFTTWIGVEKYGLKEANSLVRPLISYTEGYMLLLVIFLINVNVFLFLVYVLVVAQSYIPWIYPLVMSAFFLWGAYIVLSNVNVILESEE